MTDAPKRVCNSNSAKSRGRKLQVYLWELLMAPAMLVILVGIAHLLHVVGLNVELIAQDFLGTPRWVVLGWNIGSSVFGWSLLVAITFVLGKNRSSRASIFAWMLSFAFPFAEVYLYRRWRLGFLLQVATVHSIATIAGIGSWFVGWLIGRRQRPNDCRQCLTGINSVAMSIIVLGMSALGWCLLHLNTVNPNPIEQ